MTKVLVKEMDLHVDPEAFEEVFAALFARAQRVALRVLGTAEAEDVAAEVLARTLAAWPRVKRFPEAWVTKVATNLAIDAVRRRSPRTEGHDPEAPEDAVVTRMALLMALRRLPRRQREVLVLRYLVELPEADVAQILGLTAGTVKTHTRRGLETLGRGRGRDLEEVTDALLGPPN